MVSSVSSTDSSAWTTLQKQLAAADTDKDGVISKDELVSALASSSGTVSELVSDADADEDGAVSLSEFISFADRFSSTTGLALLATQENDAALTSLFSTIDTDGSASLSSSELRSASTVLKNVESYAEQIAALAEAITKSAAASTSASATTGYTIPSDVQKLLDDIDRNSDGTFDKKDIVRMLLEADGTIKPQASSSNNTDSLLNMLYLVSVAQARAAQDTAASATTTTSSTTTSSTGVA